MRKTFNQTAQKAYCKPDCKTIAFGLEGVLCGSSTFNSTNNTENIYLDTEEDI